MSELIKRLEALVQDVKVLVDEAGSESEQANYQYILMRVMQAEGLAKQVR
jgi:hypothetical protein